jgi:protein-S-isoprenylcysteine O-methyltransferase Ste14
MSALLVSLQFILIGLIAWPFHMPRLDPGGAILFAAGLLVFMAAWLAMGAKNFTVMPEPKHGGELVTGGIYGLVRHPMYLAVLLCALGASVLYAAPWKWIATGVLALVLWLKLRREERFLLQHYQSYAAYRSHTKALVPFLL